MQGKKMAYRVKKVFEMQGTLQRSLEFVLRAAKGGGCIPG